MVNRFPGRFGFFASIAGPLLFIAGIATLLGIASADTAEQLRNIRESEGTAALGFSLLSFAYVLLPFALFTLATDVYERHPRLGAWGGALAVAAPMGLLFFVGAASVEQQAAILSDQSEIVRVLENDEPFTPFIFLLPLSMLGFPLLGFGAYRTGVLPLWGGIGLAMALLLPAGILGGIPVIALLATLGVAAALVPYGFGLWTGRRSFPGSASAAVAR